MKRPVYLAVEAGRWPALLRRVRKGSSARGLAAGTARYLGAVEEFKEAASLPLPGPGMRPTELCALAAVAETRGEKMPAVRALRRTLVARPVESWIDYVAVYDAIGAHGELDERVDALCDLAALFRMHRGLWRADEEAPRLTMEMATLMVRVGAERDAVELLDGTDGSTKQERFWWRMEAAEAMLGLGRTELAVRFARRALRAAGPGRPPEQARSVMREARGAIRPRMGVGKTAMEAALAWLNGYRQGRFEDLYDLYHHDCAERSRYRNREHYGRSVRRAVTELGIRPGPPKAAPLQLDEREAIMLATQPVRRRPGDQPAVLCWQIHLVRTVAGWRLRRCRSTVVVGPDPDPGDPLLFRGIPWEG